jgi:catechol-2,3-dioxygenase
MLRAMITRTQFVLAVPDLEKSSTFYRNVLGAPSRGACASSRSAPPTAIAS